MKSSCCTCGTATKTVIGTPCRMKWRGFGTRFRKPRPSGQPLDLARVRPDSTNPLPVMKENAGRILMFVENYYPGDPRVRNESQVLVSAGYQVIVVALRAPGQARSEIINGVQVYRMPRLVVFSKTPLANPNALQRICMKFKPFT